MYNRGTSALTSGENPGSPPTTCSVRICAESKNKCGVADLTALSSPLAKPPSRRRGGEEKRKRRGGEEKRRRRGGEEKREGRREKEEERREEEEEARRREREKEENPEKRRGEKRTKPKHWGGGGCFETLG